MSNTIFSLKDAALRLNGNAGPVEILHGITMEVEAGESIGLIGPSGSGKSSLLMVMGGLEQATGGSVRAMGEDLTAMDEDQLARFRRDRMGIVFRAASSSVWPLPAPPPRAPRSCWRMNRPETSTA